MADAGFSFQTPGLVADDDSVAEEAVADNNCVVADDHSVAEHTVADNDCVVANADVANGNDVVSEADTVVAKADTVRAEADTVSAEADAIGGSCNDANRANRSGDRGCVHRSSDCDRRGVSNRGCDSRNGYRNRRCVSDWDSDCDWVSECCGVVAVATKTEAGVVTEAEAGVVTVAEADVTNGDDIVVADTHTDSHCSVCLSSGCRPEDERCDQGQRGEKLVHVSSPCEFRVLT